MSKKDKNMKPKISAIHTYTLQDEVVDKLTSVKVDQNNFYQMFDDSQSVCRCEVDSLFINCENILPWCAKTNPIYETGSFRRKDSESKPQIILNANAVAFVPLSVINEPQMMKTTHMNKNNNNCQIYNMDKQRKHVSNNPYRSIPIRKSQKCVRIPRELTTKAVAYIKENICDLYYYMSIMNTLQFINKRNKNKYNDIKIFNYNLHHIKTDDIIYGVAKKVISRGFEWCMMDKLYTAQQIYNQWKIKPIYLPECIEYSSNDSNKIKSVLFDQNKFIKIIKKTKWCKIKIYQIINNKDRITFKPTKEQFVKKCIEFICKDKNINLIPILMIYDNNIWGIEYLYMVKIIKDNFPIDVGISFAYNRKSVFKVQVNSLHINKHYIKKQHELIHSNCKCLCDFNDSIIDELSIGNADNLKNALNAKDNIIKRLKEKIKNLTTNC